MFQSTRGPQTLLSTKVLTNAVPVTGAACKVRPISGDGVADDAQVFTFVATTQGNGGANSPTVQAVVEGSADGLGWYPLANTPANAADDAVRHEQMAEVANARVPAFIRARTVLGGGTPPTKAVAVVYVQSNGDFSLDVVPA